MLTVADLSVAVRQGGTFRDIVRGVSFTVQPGEIFALIGESGSGKTTIARSILQLTGDGVRSTGQIRFGETDLLACSARRMRSLRGNEIAFIPQDALSALNPRMRVGRQLAEVLRLHATRNRPAPTQVRQLLEAVELTPDVERRYPHELSGGMRQRVLIAMALANRPQLILADEPTTALDVTVQAQILNVLRAIRDDFGTSVILVSHDLGVVGQVADHVLVLYAGEVMERGPTESVLRDPAHPYTSGLIQSTPTSQFRRRLIAIPGHPVPAMESPGGCPYHTRCTLSHGRELCSKVPPGLSAASRSTGVDHMVACHFEAETTVATDEDVAVLDAGTAEPDQEHDRVPVLRVRDLRVTFTVRSGGLRRTARDAVKGVSFDLYPNEVLGLVGESGSGKSTIALSVLGLVPEASGVIEFEGRNLLTAGASGLRDFRRHAHIVMQDPYSSLNPRQTIRRSVGEPLRARQRIDRSQVAARVDEMLGDVGLSTALAARYPHQLSGGMRQRVGIARALVAAPEVVVFDEPVSALDVSVQAQILNLLADLRQVRPMCALFITHDLAVARHVADRIAVMRDGVFVEVGTTQQIFEAPVHPYTRELLAASPSLPSQHDE